MRPIVRRRPVLRSPALLVWRLARLSRRLRLSLRLGWPVVIATLRHRRQRHRRAQPQSEQPSAELELPFHFTLHLRALLLPAVIRLHRLRQFRQRLEVREHVVILEHRNVFLRNLRLVLGMRAHPNRRQHQH